MDRKAFLEDCISGRKMEHIPFGMWMHFHLADRDPFTLAEATNGLLEKYDISFVKITPSGLFMVQDYGASIKFGSKEWQHPLMLDNLLPDAGALESIPDLDVMTGAYRRELDQVELTVKRIGGRAPVFMTVFTPITVICKMLGNANIPAYLQYYMNNHPAALHTALRRISDTVSRFVDGCIERGVDGFFYATQAANFQTLASLDQYREFGVAYDVPIAERMHNAGKLILLHVCMHEVMLDAVKDYPVDIINWDNIYSGTSIAEARKIIPDKVLAGGIDIFRVNDYSLHEIDAMVQRAIDEGGKEKFILAPTCVLLASTPEENLKEISRYVKTH